MMFGEYFQSNVVCFNSLESTDLNPKCEFVSWSAVKISN